jgi:hypothetical protein
MKAKAPPPASTLNREIVDDRDGRLSIHTHEINLTQAHLPYQPVTGKRLPSTKHFAVFADRIVLSGTLQNPGRNIELNAREIVIETPSALDVAGAYADKDFEPGKPPIQNDAKPGASGTDGTAGTVGGDGGSIVINARRMSHKTAPAHALSAMELAAIGTRAFAEHPPKLDNAAKLDRIEIGKTKMFTSEVVIFLDDGRVEGLTRLLMEAAQLDRSAGRVGMRLALQGLTVTGTLSVGGPQRISSPVFACKIDAAAAMNADGKIGTVEMAVSLVVDKPLRFQAPYVDGVLSGDALKMIRTRIAAHLKGAVEALLASFAATLAKAPLVLLAGGGRGGRGQDGHAGVQGDGGADGAKTSKHGAETEHGWGFPEEAKGHNGQPGGRAGSPGKSGNGGNGGAIALNVVDPVAFEIVYGIGGGGGGVQASPGDRGLGGRGGQGAMCKMFNSRTGRPVEDRRAPDGQDGPLGPPAIGTGEAGSPGKAGQPLQFNGKPFAGGAVPAFSFGALAPNLSLSQLLMTQNSTDMDFLNAKTEAELTALAENYSWLIDINRPFVDGGAASDIARVPETERKVRAGIHNSAIVSLMRPQQGLDFYGHSYNWTPVLNLAYLTTRTAEIVTLGTTVETQYTKYVEKGATDKARLEAFRTAKDEICLKLGTFEEEAETLESQIDNLRDEIGEYSEDLLRQRTLLLEKQLAFKDQLIKHLREQAELGLSDFLDILGTVIGCVGGVIGGAGGVKTAINAVKKAEEFNKKVKGVVEVFKKAKGTLDSLNKAYKTIKGLGGKDNPDAGKILVDSDELDKMLKEYLGKLESAGELRKAMDYYVELAQARNMACYNYTTLVAQLLDVQTQHDQLHSGIQNINAELAAHQDNVLPLYTAYMKDAYEEMQQRLLRNVYLENRAYEYWSLQKRQFKTDNLNISLLGATHDRLMGAIDRFREKNEEFDDFRQKVTISAARYPNEFAGLLETRSLAFTLDIRNEEGFDNLSHIIARSFKLHFPDLIDVKVAGAKKVLSLNLIHSGQAILNSNVDRDKPGALHAFSHRPRVRLYKIDYTDKENTAGGLLGDDKAGYIGLSPFALWRIDFDLKGNEWLDKKVISTIKTVEITFEGRGLGPGRKVRFTKP